jgi:hypothetical protein
VTSAPHPEHGSEELCPAGTELYARALGEGRIAAVIADRLGMNIRTARVHIAKTRRDAGQSEQGPTRLPHRAFRDP